MLPSLSSLPSSFQIVLTCQAQTPDMPAEISTNTHPQHDQIDAYLTAFSRLAPRLNLADGQIRATGLVSHNEVTFSPVVPESALSGFLIWLALIGAEDLAEIRRQVDGYPYDRIAIAYEAATMKAKRIRRVLPKIELDASPFLPLTVANVLGGPATRIRLSKNRDVIRLRGVPFNHTFAKLANDAILKRMQATLKARLPIIGNPRSARS